MAIPLYEQTRWDERLSRPLPGANPGLLFDKFATGWNEQWGQLGNDEKRDFLKKVIQYVGDSTDSIQAALKQAHQQRAKLIDFLQGDSKDFQTEWRFVSGLGSSHPFEAGFIWHRTLGVPYLPGSSVKGMMRAWASQWMDDCEDTVHIERINRLFGPETTSAETGNVGAFVVLDALPTDPPKLELDILNPHYQPYYSDPLNHHPADYYSPVPVFFLAVAPEQSFRFAIAPRPRVAIAQADWEWIWKILGDALQYIGAGGKTAVGYGYMTNFEEQTEKRADEWLQAALDDLRNDKDYKGLAEQELWKKGLSEKYLLAPKVVQPVVLKMIQKKWQEFGLDWNNPKKGSARTAIKNYESH